VVNLPSNLKGKSMSDIFEGLSREKQSEVIQFILDNF
jgi:hypothetical protein